MFSQALLLKWFTPYRGGNIHQYGEYCATLALMGAAFSLALGSEFSLFFFAKNLSYYQHVQA
jgi:hypothetical protein